MPSAADITKLRIAVVDDEPIARARLKRMLAAMHNSAAEVVLECCSAPEFASQGPGLGLDVVFMDINMPDGSGMAAMEQWEGDRPSIIFVTAHEEYALRAFGVGALDYLTKPVSAARLQIALRRASQRMRSVPSDSHALQKERLTDRQLDILVLVAQHKSNKEVARALSLSHFTVRNHLSNLFRMFDVDRRGDLLRRAQADGFLPKDQCFSNRVEIRCPTC